MNSKKFRSKTILTVVTAPLVGTVMSSSFVASADWNFSLGKDDTKGVYYIGSGSTREEYANMWEFIKALISKIFSFSRSEENVKDMSNSADDKSVKLEQQQEGAVSRYETIAEILKKMTNKNILEKRKEFDDGSCLYKFETGDIQKNRTEIDGSYYIFDVAEVKINKKQMVVDYTVSGSEKKVVIDFEKENSLEKAINILENVELHHNIVRNQIGQKFFNEQKLKNLFFAFVKDGKIKIFPWDGKVIKVKNGDYIKKILLSNDYCRVTLQYADKKSKEYDLTNLGAARELNGILENIKVEEEAPKLKNTLESMKKKNYEANIIKKDSVCAKVKEKIIELRRGYIFDQFEDPVYKEMDRSGAKLYSEDIEEDFFRRSNECFTFKFCVSDLCRYDDEGEMEYKLNLANVTISPDELVVDYRPYGLEKFVTVNFDDKDALEKATAVLEAVRTYAKVLEYLEHDLPKKLFIDYEVSENKKSVCFRACKGKVWKNKLVGKVIQEAIMGNNYSNVALQYENGDYVFYDLTKLEEAKNLMEVLKDSSFDSVEKQENEKEQEYK